MAVIRKELVLSRFKQAATVLGWNVPQSVWSVPVDASTGFCAQPGCSGHHGKHEGAKAAVIGAVRLDKHGRSNRYDLVQIRTCGGGEGTIRHTCSGDSMFDWLDGLVSGAYDMKRIMEAKS